MKTTVNTDPKVIEEFLTRSVEHVYPSKKAVASWLSEGTKKIMYLGIDPTGPTLHLGHAIILRKMRAFQDMGHKLILLIGDFTGLIGDPTDKSATRVRQTREQVLENAKLYKQQAAKIIRFDGENPAELRYNSAWLAKLTFEELIELAAHFTVQQMLDRSMFKQRFYGLLRCPNIECKKFLINVFNPSLRIFEAEKTNKITCTFCNKEFSLKDFEIEKREEKPIYLHEFLYPLMQGYDSVAMDVDGEIGGNDQIFNMLAGRTLLKAIKQKEKFVIGMKLLTDPTGKKMGKSEGNMITLKDGSQDMFGKVMGWTDEMILPGFELLTDVTETEIEQIKREMAQGENPRIYKARLAKDVVKYFFDETQAQEASLAFDALFQKHDLPEQMETYQGPAALSDILVANKFASSKTDARRLIQSGAVKVEGKVVSDTEMTIIPTQKGVVIQKGKRFFVRVIL